MADYPTLPQAEGTTLVPRSGLRLRYASNGSVRARALSSAIRYDPKIVHKVLSLAQWQALQAFEAANRGITFNVTIVAEGVTLTCLFAERPFDYAPIVGGGGSPLFNVTSYLVQAI
jgi:hypothetical protein